MTKKDFPIFANNPGLVFLDNGASTQKPQMVIDEVSEFVAHDYANIHRGMYSLSERSEELYYKSKEAVAGFIGCKPSEIIYTYNSTYGINLIAQSLVKSKFLKKWDVVLLGIREHHSNILPWQILAQEYGFTIKFIDLMVSDEWLVTSDENYDINWKDFEKKYDKNVKVVAVSQTSNVTGKIYDVQKIGKKLREETFFLVDGSQSVPNFAVNVAQIWCDCLVFTGHKMMAYTWIGVVYLKKEYIKSLSPMIAGGGTVEDVDTTSYRLHGSVDKFEAGTPNIIGAVSLLKAIEYITSIGGIQKIREHEQQLVHYFMNKLSTEWRVTSKKIEIVWPMSVEGRIAVFSFVLPWVKNFNMIGEKFAEANVCIRCGGHCAYPLHKFLGREGTCRASFYRYNDKNDVDKFFEVLNEITKS